MSPTMPRPLALCVLLIATMVWGFAFIAQKTAMDAMGPLTFIASRYILGGLAILPLALIEHRRRAEPISRRDWQVIGLVSVAFFIASWLQQAGLMSTSVTNGGFLTGLYVFFVPFILLVLLRTAPHPVVWIGMPMAVAGLYLLNGASFTSMVTGDYLIIASAFFWGVHVLVLGYLARSTARPIFISSVIFLLAGAFAAIGAFATEPVTLDAFRLGWGEILYAGLLSTAVGFTFQAIAQQHVPPANAAIILSAESLFAALGGALFLGERLPLIGYLGAALIFIAIVVVETLPLLRRKSAATG